MTNKNLNNLLDKLACHVGDIELNYVLRIQGVCLVPWEVFDMLIEVFVFQSFNTLKSSRQKPKKVKGLSQGENLKSELLTLISEEKLVQVARISILARDKCVVGLPLHGLRSRSVF